MRDRVIFIIAVMSLLTASVVFLTGSNTIAQEQEGTDFKLVTAEVGLSGVNGNFLAWGDYNNDGYQDLLVGGRRLFRNSGPPGYTFTEVTGSVGITSGGGYGTWGDYNNDGWLDFSSPGRSRDYLYENQAGKSFIERGNLAGVNVPDVASTGSGWADYDRDGLLDLYVTGGEDWNDGDPVYHADILYHNNGDGSFENVTAQAGVDTFSNPSYGRGTDWCDYNNDGWIDLYVTNYRQRLNYLYENNWNGTFTDVAAERNVADGEPYDLEGNPDPYDRPGHGVGTAWADFDNDQDFDMWVTNLNHKDARTSDDSLLYRNEGASGRYAFTNVRGASGIEVKPYVFPNEGDELMVGVAIGDYDNDGFQDIFLPQIYDNVAYAYSFFYRNLGESGLTFEEVTQQTGVQVWNTYAGCFADYDNDGDLDLLTAGKLNSTEGALHELHLYQNNADTGNHWLSISLNGMESNSFGIGAVVTVTTEGGNVYTRQIEGGMGCHGMQNEIGAHYGLGDEASNVDISVQWPSGRVQKLSDIPVDQKLVIVEDNENKPDLYLSNIDLSKEKGVTNETIDITVDVENIGLSPATYYEMDFYAMRNGTSLKVEIDRSVIDEPLTAGAVKQFSASWKLPDAGLYTIYARASGVMPSESSQENNADEINIIVKGKNQIPVAVLEVSVTEPRVNQEVIFYGTGSYDDEEVVKYKFDFGDAQSSGWVTSDQTAHTYTKAGNFTATLEVVDDEGKTSEPAQQLITVTAAGGPGGGGGGGGSGGGGGTVPAGKPVAVIDALSPEDPALGEEVFFSGHGISAEKTSIITYEWKCDRIGYLSEYSSFYYQFWEDGNFRISFRVLDSNGLWSDYQNRTIRVTAPDSKPVVTISEPQSGSLEVDSDFSVYGDVTDEELPVERVEYRIDNGSWTAADGTYSFSIDVPIEGFEEGSSHRIEIKAFNGIRYSDTVTVHFSIAEEEAEDENTSKDTVATYLVYGIILVIVFILAVIFIIIVRKDTN